MILDLIDHQQFYRGMVPGLDAGFDFLKRTDLATLEDGRHAIDGDRVFALIARGPGVGREQAMLEAHRKYLDIQFVIAGVDQIGWRPIAECTRPREPYSDEKDLVFFYDRPETWCKVPAGAFTIFLPQDAHAPLGCENEVHKAVVKIRL